MGIVAHSLLMAFAVAGIDLQLHARHLERTDSDDTSDVAALPTVPPVREGGYRDIIERTAAAVARERARARGADPPAA